MLPFLAEHSHPHGDHHWVGGRHGQYDYLSWHLITSGAVSYHLYVRSSMNLMPPALKVLFQITYIEMMELVCN